MITYPISESSTEKIVFRVDENTYSLIRWRKSPEGEESPPYVITLNKREALKLYQAIGDSILNGAVDKSQERV